MTIIFQNPGLIDLRAVTTMGLNAKEGKNPIGHFGTGLKYAIAVCLREGNQVSIWRGEDEYKFLSKSEQFRGKEFQFVYMITETAGKYEEKQLGFTLDLGKNWEIWQALRELESNCRDEEGTSFSAEDWQTGPDLTSIIVSGRSFEEAYSGVGGIFLQGKPIWEDEEISIFRAERPEYQNWLYYRGVRCQALEKPSMYRYNIKQKCVLTEDRTFKHSWEPTAILTTGIVFCKDEEILSNILSANENVYECGLDFNRGYVDVPDIFCDTVNKLGARSNRTAWKMARLARKLPDFNIVTMNELHEKMLEMARAFLTRMGESRINEFEVLMASDLGSHVLGCAIGGRIYLSQRVFEMGLKQLISCLYEEFIHLDRGYLDKTYEMQNFLFDTIITYAAKQMGEIL